MNSTLENSLAKRFQNARQPNVPAKKYRKYIKSWWVFVLLLIVLFACDSNEKKIEVRFESLEDSLSSIQTKNQLVGFLTRHPEIRDNFFGREAYPDDSVFINELFNRFSHPAIDTLVMETHRIFGNGEGLKKQFEEAFKNIKQYYPDFTPPKIITVISGLETDVMVTDSVVIVGLDYFLGADTKFKPNMYEYMQKRYHKDFVVPSVLLLYGISDKYCKTNLEDKTTLADMIAYGKAYAFTKLMLPTVADSTIIGYTQREIDGAVYNESKIWKHMIGDQILFGTSHMIKQKYISERPKTVEISAQCPGRIGMWVGWRICNQYMSEGGKSLTELMQEPDAQKILKLSKYRPAD